MAAKIPAPGLELPRKLINIMDFKASGNCSIFPQEFLPDGTTIDINPKATGESYELSWTNGRGRTFIIADLTWTPQGLMGTGVRIHDGSLLLLGSPNVSITPTGTVNRALRTWKGKISFGDEGETLITPTVGTFVAQASTDGGNDGDSNLVTHAP